MKNKKDNPILAPLSEVAAEAEREHIIKVLKSTNSNKTRAAEVLGISRKNLWEKMKTYSINDSSSTLPGGSHCE